MTAYTLRKGLVHDHHRRSTEPFGSPVALGFTLIFLLSVPVAFVSVLVAQLLWLSTILLRYPLRKLTGITSSE
jgi:hypothetical protein